MVIYCTKRYINIKMKLITQNIESMGVSVDYMVGENAQDNDAVIDAASPDDYWFHSGYTSSTHVVAIIPTDLILDKKQKKLIITQGAVLCKQYTSKIRSKQHVEIVFTKIKNLVKTEVPGQVIMVNSKTIII